MIEFKRMTLREMLGSRPPRGARHRQAPAMTYHPDICDAIAKLTRAVDDSTLVRIAAAKTEVVKVSEDIEVRINSNDEQQAVLAHYAKGSRR